MVERKRYRQRWTPGAIVQIDLKDGTFGYGQVLEDPLVAFYDYKTEDDIIPNIEDIIKSSVAFKLSVMKYCVNQDWKIIGKVKMDEALNQWPNRYRVDAITRKLYIRKELGPEVPATWEECEHLECAAVWEPQSIEQRLRDHFAERPCWYVESKKPNWEFIPIKEFYKQYGYDYINEFEEKEHEQTKSSK